MAELDLELADPENATNATKLLELHNTHVEYEKTLSDLYKKWEILAE